MSWSAHIIADMKEMAKAAERKKMKCEMCNREIKAKPNHIDLKDETWEQEHHLEVCASCYMDLVDAIDDIGMKRRMNTADETTLHIQV